MKRALELADILLSREYPDLIADQAAEELGCLSAEADSLRAVNAGLLEALENLIEAADSMSATYGRLFGKTPEDDDTFIHDQWAEGFLSERADAARAAIASARKQKGEA